MTRRNKIIELFGHKTKKGMCDKISCLIIVISILTSVNLFARQNFANQWINFDQEYFKISISENGIYRLTYNQLENSGFPVSSIDPRRIQLFYKGTELAIQLEGQQDGSFDPMDYIEFYAVKNDGSSDTELYVTPEAQPHTFYNLFSDVSAYFLTYKLSTDNGKRISSFFENNVDGIADETSYQKELLQLFSSSYHEGESYGSTNDIVLSQYDNYEGWTGSFASRGQSLNLTIQNIINQLETEVKPKIEVLLAGGNNNSHNAEIFVGASESFLRSIGTAQFNKDENFLFTTDIEWSDISDSGELAVRVNVNGVNGGSDRIAFSYIRLIYLHTFDLSGEDNQKLILKENTFGKSFIKVLNPSDNSRIWDITNPVNPSNIGINTSFQELSAVIPNTSENRTLYLQSQTLVPSLIERALFEPINPVDYNYLIKFTIKRKYNRRKP